METVASTSPRGGMCSDATVQGCQDNRSCAKSISQWRLRNFAPQLGAAPVRN